MRPRLALSVLGALACPLGALAQTHTAPQVASPAPAAVVVDAPPDPDSAPGRALAEANKRRVELERDLYKLRATYFRNIRNVEMRQVGLSKLREFTDPAVFPSLLKVFKRDKEDVRGTILDMLEEQASPYGDATLAWAAVFDEDSWYRDAASERLIRRVKSEEGDPSFYVQSVIAKGLKSGLNREVSAAANLSNVLNLVEAIPMLINAQVTGQTAQVGGGGGDTSLAWIMVGTQQAFIADLEPVVADSAVAFDPTLGVVTEGVVLRVMDAAVITYRTEVHTALVDLSSRAWGQPTTRLGWDNRAWHDWYTREFKPYWDEKEAQRRAEASGDPAPAPPSGGG